MHLNDILYLYMNWMAWLNKIAGIPICYRNEKKSSEVVEILMSSAFLFHNVIEHLKK